MVTVRTSHTVEEKKKEEISTAELKRVLAKASALVVKEEADKAAKIAAADAAAAAATAAQEAAAAAGMTHPLFPLTAASVLVIVCMFCRSPSCSTVAAAAASDHRTAPATPAAAPLPEPKPEPVIQDIKRQYLNCFHLCDFVARRHTYPPPCSNSAAARYSPGRASHRNLAHRGIRTGRVHERFPY